MKKAGLNCWGGGGERKVLGSLTGDSQKIIEDIKLAISYVLNHLKMKES